MNIPREQTWNKMGRTLVFVVLGTILIALMRCAIWAQEPKNQKEKDEVDHYFGFANCNFLL